ncbi:MAG: ATP-dependent metallopeptidase FtsH/Yme1/Tma family protein [Gaiellales bacterium]
MRTHRIRIPQARRTGTIAVAALALAASLSTPAAARASASASPFTHAPNSQTAPNLPQLAYSAMLHAADAGGVRNVLMDENSGTLLVTLTDGRRRLVLFPVSDGNLAQTLTRDGATVTLGTVGSPPTGGSSDASMLFALAVMLGLGTVILLVATWRTRRRRAEAGPEPQLAPTSDTRFSDVAGCDEAVEELRDTLDFLRNPERFERLGARMPSGILLHGPPGTGKTLLAKAVAGEAGVPFFAMSGSDFVEMYVGVGPKRVRELFAKAKKSEAGAVVFIDEIDAIGRRRAGRTGGNQEAENTLNALLVELDGFRGRPGLVCIAATNRLELLDEALLRPGRFGMQVQVDTPNESGRRQILELYAKDKPLAPDVELDALASYTAGSSGAQLADMINQAAIMTARDGRDQITDADLREGHLRVLAGPERAASVMREDERRLVAWHEAGHVLTAELCETQDKAQRVTIRPRGRAAGLAVYGQTDRALHSRRYLHERMICILGGRAAEQLLVAEISSGAANDLQQANTIARKAVTELGFSDRVGQIIGGVPGQEFALSDDTRRVSTRRSSAWWPTPTPTHWRCWEGSAAGWMPLARHCSNAASWSAFDILVVIGGKPEPRIPTPRRRPLRAVPAAQPLPALAATEAHREGALVSLARWIERRSGSAERRRGTAG